MTPTDLLLIILTILGAISLAIHGFKGLLAIAPSLLIVRSKAWKFLADTAKTSYLRRAAVASGIEQVVNRTGYRLQQHLPKGWVKRAKIRWVRTSTPGELREGAFVLRVRPETDQDTNFINAAYTYFLSSLFPGTRDMLPPHVVNAIALSITRSALEADHPYLLDEFDKLFLTNSEVADQKTLECFADCLRLNSFGFLMGPLVREIHHAAQKARFGPSRKELPKLVEDILEHMLQFQNVNLQLPDDAWFLTGPYTSYGFSLVSRPPTSRPAVDAYLRRAQDMLSKGVQRLYVLGRSEEYRFVQNVLRALPSIRELRIEELFRLWRDYRGQPSGVGALFCVDELLAELDLAVRPTALGSAPIADSEMFVNESSAFDHGGDANDISILSETVENIIVHLSDVENQWIPLSHLGNVLRQQLPNFTPQRYGGRNLLTVLEHIQILEFDHRGAGPAKAVYVRLQNQSNNTVKAQTEREIEYAADRGALAGLSSLDDFTREVESILGTTRDPEGWMFLGTVGKHLKKRYPNLDFHQFGAIGLKPLLESLPSFEMQERGDGNNKSHYVRSINVSS